MSFVEIKNYFQIILLSPADAIINIAKTFFQKISLVIHKNIVINRKTHVVTAPALYDFQIIFADKAVIMLFCIFAALGNPAAQINSFFKSCKFSHSLFIKHKLVWKYQISTTYIIFLLIFFYISVFDKTMIFIS